jgi:hypothetical protein
VDGVAGSSVTGDGWQGEPLGETGGIRSFGGGGDMELENNFPKCLKCTAGVLVPLSDYGRDGAPITYKAWVCTSPDCGFNLRIDNGEISLGKAVGHSMK